MTVPAGAAVLRIASTGPAGQAFSQVPRNGSLRALPAMETAAVPFPSLRPCSSLLFFRSWCSLAIVSAQTSAPHGKPGPNPRRPPDTSKKTNALTNVSLWAPFVWSGAVRFARGALKQMSSARRDQTCTVGRECPVEGAAELPAGECGNDDIRAICRPLRRPAAW
jgi:hypothetical protein